MSKRGSEKRRKEGSNPSSNRFEIRRKWLRAKKSMTRWRPGELHANL